LILLRWWVLQSLSSEERQQILLRVAEALVVNEERINAENEADVEAAQLNGIAKSLVGRLTIKPGKVSHKSGYRSPLSRGLPSCHPLPAI
jgi:gamma-glutamyl phosphate reductase